MYVFLFVLSHLVAHTLRINKNHWIVFTRGRKKMQQDGLMRLQADTWTCRLKLGTKRANFQAIYQFMFIFCLLLSDALQNGEILMNLEFSWKFSCVFVLDEALKRVDDGRDATHTFTVTSQVREIFAARCVMLNFFDCKNEIGVEKT